MAINSTEVSYGFGQMGSAFNDGDAVMKPPTGKVFVAITFLANTSFEAHGGLVAQQEPTSGLEYISTEDSSGAVQTAHDASDTAETTSTGSGGLVVDNTQIFPKGLTIYGRWTEIHPTTADPDGGIIAYIGD
tara:strand:+ start:1385 stop:1780 length:396 start_codon:yes stop_codon:yes gene_type:complete